MGVQLVKGWEWGYNLSEKGGSEGYNLSKGGSEGYNLSKGGSGGTTCQRRVGVRGTTCQRVGVGVQLVREVHLVSFSPEFAFDALYTCKHLWAEPRLCP